jgi:hypothetical protein
MEGGRGDSSTITRVLMVKGLGLHVLFSYIFCITYESRNIPGQLFELEVVNSYV